MADSLSDLFLSPLSFSPVSRVRRNHGLEHATLHILAQRDFRRPLAGHSDMSGFWILGDVTTEELGSAVQEALNRLRGGEYDLAIHPNCGTNFVASGFLAGSVAFLGMLGSGRRTRDRLERLPLVITLATLALIAAQPLGLLLQKQVTTSGDPEALEILEIIASQRGRFKTHRIITTG
jgi:hypothetical protein